jgi:uncharacterized protein (TIGR02001 family)
MSKRLITAVAAATLGVSALSTPAMAEVSATAGFVSDYYFRGSNLGDGGANGSFDWANDSGFSAGVWAIDDRNGSNDGLEYDIYGGYAAETDSSFSWSVGLARYEYTYASNFEQEVNLGLGMGDFGLAVDIGQADSGISGDDATDYNHYAVSWAANDVYGLTLGNMDPDTDTDDDDYNYVEVSASGEVSELDVSMTLGTVSLEGVETSGYLVLSVSKTFDSLGY